MSQKKNNNEDNSEETSTDVKALASEAAKFAAEWDKESIADPAVKEVGDENRPLSAEETEALERELGPAASETELSVDTIISSETGQLVIKNDEQQNEGQEAKLESESGPQTETALTPAEYDLPKELVVAQAKSIVESILFASVHPVTLATLKSVFYGTNINSENLNDILVQLGTEYTGGDRGIGLEEIAGGFQLRTKIENAGWLKKMVKARPFRLSGPALEVLSIIAYKQPVIKSEIDQIRGVESGHLVRALMEKNIVKFAGKSDLPGKPMLYGTTKQFLELFGLRNIRELPTLSEIDKLIPEGIGEISEIDGETLGSLADKIGLPMGKSYSDSEAELLSITDQLGTISTSSEFFEQEKKREREKRDQERAQDLRERKIVGEELLEVDLKWLVKYEAKVEAAVAEAQNTSGAIVSEANVPEDVVPDYEGSAVDEPKDILSEENLAKEDLTNL